MFDFLQTLGDTAEQLRNKNKIVLKSQIKSYFSIYLTADWMTFFCIIFRAGSSVYISGVVASMIKNSRSQNKNFWLLGNFFVPFIDVVLTALDPSKYLATSSNVTLWAPNLSSKKLNATSKMFRPHDPLPFDSNSTTEEWLSAAALDHWRIATKEP